MKQILFFLLIGMLSFSSTQAQDFADIDKSIMDAAYFPTNAAKRVFAKTAAEKKAGEPKVRVLYSRPLVKGRTIFGDLIKYNEPWRIGANESTEVLFSQDVIFGNTPVKAGRYTLIIVPTKNVWTVHLNSKTDGWGHYSYEAKWNVAEYQANVQSSSSTIEALSITLYEKSKNLAHLKIGWDRSIAEIPIGF